MMDTEYERKAAREAYSRRVEIEGAPLSERKEAQAEFFKVMKGDPALVAERLGWLIDGNYGYGEMQQAKQVVASPRMNRRASLTQLVGLYEWQVPAVMVNASWKKLTGSEKAALDAAVDVVIEAAEEDMKGDPTWSSRTGRK
jgi:hypothetical protein